MKKLKPRTPSSLKKYGLTVPEWQAMSDAQGGRCFICGRGGRTRHLTIDHDHWLERQGVMHVRGLLCGRCNTALGKFEWSDEVLIKLVVYVTERILAARAANSVRGSGLDGTIESSQFVGE